MQGSNISSKDNLQLIHFFIRDHNFFLNTQSITLTKVTKPTVSSEEASSRTIRRRSGELEKHRNLASGGAPLVQLHAEMKSLSTSERQKLLADLEFKIELPALTGLAIKADLCLPWSKMRSMKRYRYP